MSNYLTRIMSYAAAGLLLICAGAANSAKIGAIGTTQMAGDDGIFNRPYSLGAKGNMMNITIRSAEYTVGQINIDNSTYTPDKNEKLLLIKFTIHNPENRGQYAGDSTFSFTAVDSKNENHKSISYIGIISTNSRLLMTLKPAQKVEAYTVIKVNAEGEVPKLIVSRGSGLVLRYALKGQVKPLKAPYSDPSDLTGATVAKEIICAKGEYYHYGKIDFKVEGVETIVGPVCDRKPGKNKQSFVVRLTIKNKTQRDTYFGGSTMDMDIQTADKTKAKFWSGVYSADTDESFSQSISAGQETTVRYLGKINDDTSPTMLILPTPDGRIYKYIISPEIG